MAGRAAHVLPRTYPLQAFAAHGTTTPWTGSKTPTSTSTSTSCFRRSTRCRNSRCRPASTRPSSAAARVRSTCPPNPARTSGTARCTNSCATARWTRNPTISSERRRPKPRSAGTSMALLSADRCGSRSCSTGKTACSSWPILKDIRTAGPPIKGGPIPLRTCAPATFPSWSIPRAL